ELKKFLISSGSSNPELRNSKLQLSLGGRAGFKIHSQSQPYEDPIFIKEEFEVIPVGVSYEKYMKGYFMDMVAHELGHNLGLRHNFKGNLAASEGEPMQGKVSSSIMEYLGRPFRYLDEIGSYDVEAIKYGYLGILPENRDNFCTDEDVPDSDSAKLSAECSRDDATSDPFGYFLSRLNRAVNLVIARGTHEAPAWQAAEMATIMEPTVRGLAFYRTSAESTGSQWKQFFNKPGRPQEFQQISSFVTSEVERILSPSDLEDVFKSKNEEDSLKARMGYIEFKERVLKFFKDIAT
ncbi:MAG: zinc-dependent metalloprotease, partial [Deltaproteobacteria bacterium]